jgi:anti-sigma factor RsiW
MSVTFRCDDKEMLVAFLYGEIEGESRREVERHLRTCPACAHEVEGLQAVRQDLESWLPPEPDLGFTIVPKATPAPASSRWASLAALPAWAQVAAAVLMMGAGVAIANVQVRYDARGLVVTTGWMPPQAAEPVPGISSSPVPAATTSGPAADAQGWRPALTALEQELRGELAQIRRAAETPAVSTRVSAEPGDAAIMRRVQALVDASQERQSEELALRLEQTRRDWELQRKGDLMRINQSLGTLQGRTFKTEAGQQQMFNMLRQVSTVIR